jgi:hypothetical protein
MHDLPRRDIWLLPLISILTVLGMLAGAEVVSRFVWPAQLTNSCRMPDAALGFRYQPNCSSLMKTPEGPWYTNTYNSCGYRSDAPCGPLPAGHRRIALIGSSLSEGYLVEYPNTIAARVETDLTKMCGAPVEVQNLGAVGYDNAKLSQRMDEALRLRPDAVFWVTDPYDLEAMLPGTASTSTAPPKPGLQQRVFGALKESRTFAMAQHFMFRNRSVYLPLYLLYGDKADFLRPPFTPSWQARLQVLDNFVGTLAERAHRAGIPFMVAYLPQEAQVELMTDRNMPPGIHPGALPAAIAAIAARHDVGFADSSVALRAMPTPERLYYQVDGHLSGQGQPVVAAYIARSLADEPGGPFADCNARRSASLEVGR